MKPSIEDLLASPVGVSLLDRLEAEHRPESFLPFEAFPDSNPSAVLQAAERAALMPLGELLLLALDAAYQIAGPWNPSAPESLALAYRLAPSRMAIAVAVWDRLARSLIRPFDPTLQECWISQADRDDRIARFGDFSWVYGNGEFTFDGFWTVTDPPPPIHDGLILTWELMPGPITRSRLPVHPDIRLWTVDHPSDWVRLVESYPKIATTSHLGWELPGPNQHREEIRSLCAVDGQHAARVAPLRQVLPDWREVANDYDGVHLSWAGFLTTEGFVSDLTDGGVTMLRYWGSERTLWLRDVFGSPEPLTSPELSGCVSGIVGGGVDAVLATMDRRWIAEALGRAQPD